MNSSVDFFIQQITTLGDSDSGNLSQVARLVAQFKDALPYVNDANISQRLEAMEMFLRDSKQDTGVLFEKLTQEARYIDELLAGDRQDWESVTRSP